MKFMKFKKAIIAPFDKLQEENGEEFLELIVDTIVLQDAEQNEIKILNGWEYNLSRSRHWDKEEKIYIMYDGFNDEHLEELFEDIMEEEVSVSRIILNIDGMTDLDEPIQTQIVVELNDINA